MKKILIITGHPSKDSFNYALAASYKSGANSSNASISEINIGELDFNPNLQHGYTERTTLEPDLLEASEKIKEAEHIVWVYPMWWYGHPAIMKGFIDRVFLPDFAFRSSKKGKLPEKLLKGRSARIIVTSDTPRWYDYWFMKSPSINQLKKGTLEFCGIKPVKVTYISPIKHSTDEFRKQQLEKVTLLGQQLK